MKYVEFRVPVPLTVEEFQIAQLHMVMKLSEEKTTGDEGVDVLKNEPYEEGDQKGQYTHKIYHLGQSFPGWIKKFVSKDAFKLEERAWNAYPYCKTELKNPFFDKRFGITIESKHVLGKPIEENVFNLPPEILKKRDVVHVDICDPVKPDQYKEAEDPTKFKSEKTGRGMLEKGKWKDNCEPLMTCYKLVRVEANLPLVSGKIESFICDFQKGLFLLSHRQAFCWIDEWFGMTMVDIRKAEVELAEKLKKRVADNKAAASSKKK